MRAQYCRSSTNESGPDYQGVVTPPPPSSGGAVPARPQSAAPQHDGTEGQNLTIFHIRQTNRELSHEYVFKRTAACAELIFLIER